MAAAIVFVALVAFSYGFVPLRATNDTWWHLKSGEYILQNGLPENDVFTYTAEDYPWHNHEWLAQVLFYKVFQLGGGRADDLVGLRALIGFKSLILAATYLLVFLMVQRRARCVPISVLITLLAIDVSRYTFYPRPPVLTYLLLAVFLFVLDSWKSGRWPRATLLVLPPLTALWANLHGGFLVGLIVLFFYMIGEAIEFLAAKRAKKSEHQEEKDQANVATLAPVTWLIAIGLLCFAGSLCNPYSYHLYGLPFRVMGASALVKMIPELHSPLAPATARFFISFFVMGGLIIVGLAAARFVAGERPPLTDLILLLFFGYQAVKHQRHLPLFAITTAPLLAWAAGVIYARENQWLRRRTAWLAVVACLLATVYTLGLRGARGTIDVEGEHGPRKLRQSYLDRNWQLAGGMGYVQSNYPKAVCDFIRDNGLEGRMFNPLNSAGYLIWRLSPERHKLFTDSRFDVFGDDFVWYQRPFIYGVKSAEDWDQLDWTRIGLTEEEGERIREKVGSAGWSQILDKWNVNFVLAEIGWRATKMMSDSPDWELVYVWRKPFQADVGYAVFIRKVPENADLIRRCKASYDRIQREREGAIRR